MSKEMVDFFNQLAPGWDNDPSEYEIREKLVSLMDLSPNSLIGDIGCGKGVMFEHLLKTDPAGIIAVDVAGEMIRLAKELFQDSRITYVNDDFMDVGLPMLDAVVFFNSYPHFLDKEGLANKLAQVLVKDGKMIIAHSRGKAEVNGMHKSDRAMRISIPLENAEEEAKKFQAFFTLDTLVDDDQLYFLKMIRR